MHFSPKELSHQLYLLKKNINYLKLFFLLCSDEGLYEYLLCNDVLRPTVI